ncbi:hypothetical protein MASR2M117_18220 [Paludibacter sp.]
MKFKIIITFFILLISFTKIFSQLTGRLLIESGENYASSGFYGSFYGDVNYSTDIVDISVLSGIQTKENTFNALKLNVSKDFIVNNKKFKSSLFYQWRPFSTRLNEHNFGVLFHFILNRFGFDLGLNSRIYGLSSKYAKENNYSETKIWEPVNLMYNLTLSLISPPIITF